MRGNKGKMALVAGLLFLGIAFASVAGAQEFKVGAVFSLSGPASFIGAPIRDVAVMAVDRINAGGGINGRPLKLIVEDDGGDPSRTILAVQKLIKRDNVAAVIGPNLTPTAMAVAPVMEEEKVPLIVIVGSRAVVVPPKKWIFKVSLADDLAVKVMLDFMKAKGIKKVALLSDSGPFGKAGHAVISKMAPGYGISIVADESFGPADRDVTVQLTRIRQTNPEAVVAWTAGASGVVVAKNFQQLGFKIPLFGSHGTVFKRFIELGGEAAEGVLMPALKAMVARQLAKDDHYKETVSIFVEAHEKKYGPLGTQFGMAGWDTVNLVAEALGKVGADRGKLRDYIEGRKNFRGVTGLFSFSSEDHDGLIDVALVMVKVEKGDWALAR